MRPGVGAAIRRLGVHSAVGFLPRSGWIAAIGLALVLWLARTPDGAAPSSPAALVLLGILLPLLLLSCSAWGRRWRAREADWLGALPLPRWTLAAGAQLGVAIALISSACACMLLIALESVTSSEGFEMRGQSHLEHPTAALVEGDPPLVWRLADAGWLPPPDRSPATEGIRTPGAAPTGGEIRLRPTVAPGSGPAVSVRFSLEDDRGVRAEVSARIHGRTRLSLALPAQFEGEPRLKLEREGRGAVLVLPRGALEWIRPLAAPQLARLRFPAQLALAAWAWCALGLGLGTWMRPGIAAGLAASLASAPWWAGATLASIPWPGSDLPELWRLGERALVPLQATWSATALWGGSCVVVFVGVLLAWRGIERGRGEG